MDHLASMHMTLELLQETSVGRVVKRISKRREPELAAASAKARHALGQLLSVERRCSHMRAPAKNTGRQSCSHVTLLCTWLVAGRARKCASGLSHAHASAANARHAVL